MLQTTAANWANLSVTMSVDSIKQDISVFYCLQLADNVTYILKDILICIIKEQSIDEAESTWRQYKRWKNTINDISDKIKQYNIVDMPIAKWVSMERPWFLVL
jgi:hypothetical protein